MKIKELQNKLKKEKIDAAILFFKDSNFFYFTQQKIENSFLVIPTKSKPVIFMNCLENVKIKMKKIVYENPYKDLKNYFLKNKISFVGINESKITLRTHKLISKFSKTKKIDNILTELRITKTKEEIQKVKQACLLTDNILKKITKNFTFKKESEIKELIKTEAINNNCDISFEPIIASGKDASIPHYSGNKAIKKGFMILDFGLKYKGYCADITRTFYIGTPSKSEIDKYNSFLKVQEEAINKVKEGVKVKEIENYVRKSLGSDNKYFIHSLGHGLGINVHEMPAVSNKSNEVLKEGMIITIEPGIYKNFGIRIEDDILVTKNGSKLLTNFPKNLIVISKN